jgi:hypothetical protein
VPKPETDIEYHVSLRSPIFIKLGDKIVGARSFDAKTVWVPGLIGGSIIFNTDRIWPTGSSGAIRDGVSLRTSLTIPADNIAGMVPQPFVER